MKADKQGNIIDFPHKKEPRARRKDRIKSVDGIKYFSAQQVKMLRRRVRDKAELDAKKGNTTGIREWMAIDLLTSTGLRVSEVANLRCGDLNIGYSESKLFVREGKGRISGHVIITEGLKKHLKGFLSFKNNKGETTGQVEPTPV